MISVALSPKSQTVKKLIAELFTRENIPFSSEYSSDRAGYALLCGENGKLYDVVLADSAISFQANLVTVINSDVCENFIHDNKSIMISYGLNSLATAVVSGINEASDGLSFQFCLQRSITSLTGKVYEPQEFRVIIKNKSISVSDALAYTTLALVLGLNPEKISQN